jgi:hypothetical protein
MATHDMGDDAQAALIETIERGQQVAFDAVSAFAEAAANIIPESLKDSAPKGRPQPTEIVKQVFDFSEKLLSTQRALVEKLLAAAAAPSSSSVSSTEAKTGTPSTASDSS